MSKQFTYEYEDDSKNRITFDYSPEADERMDTSVENGVPFLYLNRSAMITLAKTLIKVANGSYSDGFHVHLHKDLNADEPERLVVLLSSQSGPTMSSNRRRDREGMIAPEIATTARWECVHFGTLLEGRKEIERCKERGFSAIQVDLARVQEKGELLARIASAMKFPDYFGMNSDALDECLRDLSWLNPKGVLLVLENSRDLWRQPMLAGSLIETWLFCAESWARDGVPFHLGFTWD